VDVVGAENFQPLRDRIARRRLIGGYRRDIDFDFNVLTAFKDRIGLAPQGPGALLIIIF
jgi:hypothetical protein